MSPFFPMTETQLINPTITFEEDQDQALVVKREQHIPQSFLDRLKTERDGSANERMGDYVKVASIPTAIVEHWMREGFNIYDKNVKGADIVARLKRESLDAFLTTTKKVY